MAFHMSELNRKMEIVDQAVLHHGRGHPRADRDEIVAEICERLATGEALAAMLREDSRLPSVATLWAWERSDSAIAEAISRARRLGHHAIATDMRKVARGEAGYSTGDVQRDKLIIETDAKLLSKWDPKYYGESTQLRHADADGKKLDTAPLIGELLGMLGSGNEQAPVMLNVTPAAIDHKPAPPAVRAFDNPAYRPRAKRVAAPDVDDLV